MNSSNIDNAIKKFMTSFGLYFEIENTNYSEYNYFSHQSWGVVRYCTFSGEVKRKEDDKLEFRFSVDWAIHGGKIVLMGAYQRYPIKKGMLSYLGMDDEVMDYFVQKTKKEAEDWFKIFP